MSEETPRKRLVVAPQPPGRTPESATLSVELAPDEEVEWIWTHRPDGTSVVTGYEIHKRDPEAD